MLFAHKEVDVNTSTSFNPSSCPTYTNGTLTHYGKGRPDTLLFTVKRMVSHYNWQLEDVLPMVTRNVAKIYGLGRKGYAFICHLQSCLLYLLRFLLCYCLSNLMQSKIAPQMDADITILSPDFTVQWVFCKGKVMVMPGWVRKGMVEEI